MNCRYIYNKDSWAKGPWSNEPDLVWWICEETGYACVARRNSFGAWCGFVGVEFNHPLYQLSCSAEELSFIEVHNSDIMYSGWRDVEDVLFSPPTKRWWFGVDFMQDMDICPVFHDEVEATKTLKKFFSSKSVPKYRNLKYVKQQITMLATQLQYFDDYWFEYYDEN